MRCSVVWWGAVVVLGMGCHVGLSETPDVDEREDWVPDAGSAEGYAGFTAVARAGDACSDPEARACSGLESRLPLVCNGGKWRPESPCDQTERCDPTAGPSHGRCRPVAPPCEDRAPGEAFCASGAVRTCADPFAYSDVACPDHQNCTMTASGPQCGLASTDVDGGAAEDGGMDAGAIAGDAAMPLPRRRACGPGPLQHVGANASCNATNWSELIIPQPMPGPPTVPICLPSSPFGCQLMGADLSDQNLFCAALSSADLRGADLSGSQLYAADVSGANLTGANLNGAQLYGASFVGAELSGSDLTGAVLHAANLMTGGNWIGAELAGARAVDIVGCPAALPPGFECLTQPENGFALIGPEMKLYCAYLPGLDLSGADLKGAWLFGVELTGASLLGADLEGAQTYSLYGCPAQLPSDEWRCIAQPAFDVFALVGPGANLSPADLRDADLMGLKLDRANLIGAQLAGVELVGASLADARTSGVASCPTTLPSSRWSCVAHPGTSAYSLVGPDANLALSNLSGTDLSGTDLTSANLEWTMLQNANLSGADLSRAALAGANLTGANTDGADLSAAYTDVTTICPDGMTGPCS